MGNPVEFTIADLARQIVEKTGSRAQLEYRELPADDPKQRRPDISKARDLLGWEPKVALEEGLKQTIAYFRSVPEAAA
jgi:nucleoside-diphosphate-sugar epimerase